MWAWKPRSDLHKAAQGMELRCNTPPPSSNLDFVKASQDMIHAFWNLQVRNTKNKPLLKGTWMFPSEQTTVSRRCVAKSRVRLLNWMTSTSGNETNDHCLKLITWPAFGSSLFFSKLKMKNETACSFFIFFFFLGGGGGGNKIEFNIHCFAKLNNEKWIMRNESLCSVVIFFESWQMTN